MRVSAGEFRAVVNEAIDSMLTCHAFQEFLKAYKAEKKDENAFPVMKLAKVRNDTDDPDLNVVLMTDIWKAALLKSQIAFVMDESLENYGVFEPGCVIPYDTKVEPARIILHTRVISIEELKDRAKVVSYIFLLEMGDIKNGMLIWSFKKQLAFVRHAP